LNSPFSVPTIQQLVYFVIIDKPSCGVQKTNRLLLSIYERELTYLTILSLQC